MPVKRSPAAEKLAASAIGVFAALWLAQGFIRWTDLPWTEFVSGWLRDAALLAALSGQWLGMRRSMS
jgi:hypothetical protein